MGGPGCVFRSLAQTLNHSLWDQRVWLARQRGHSAAADKIGAHHPYTDAAREWAEYKTQRAELDDEIKGWCQGLTATELAGEVTWIRADQPVPSRFGFTLLHMFNHAIHHRGQVYAFLTRAGLDPGSTDLPMLPVTP